MISRRVVAGDQGQGQDEVERGERADRAIGAERRCGPVDGVIDRGGVIRRKVRSQQALDAGRKVLQLEDGHDTDDDAHEERQVEKPFQLAVGQHELGKAQVDDEKLQGPEHAPPRVEVHVGPAQEEDQPGDHDATHGKDRDPDIKLNVRERLPGPQMM